MHTKLALLAVLVGCTSSSPQTITGRIAPDYPVAVTSVKVVRGTTTVATSPIASDGTFRLVVPANSGLTLRLLSAGRSDVVFPRHTSGIARTFAVKGGGVPFDLGAMHFIGGAATTTFAFHDAGASTECDAEDHDSSGATCVDDGDHGGGSCESNDGESDDGGGDSEGSDSVTADDGTDEGDTVAEHNFPADGCADGGDNGGDD